MAPHLEEPGPRESSRSIEEGEHKEEEEIDTTALTGLRGFLAVHVCVFHAFLYSDLEWNLCGSNAMPPFFVLSGFCLVLAYGRSPRERHECCRETCATGPGAPEPWARKFYRARMSRILPLYYLLTAAAIPLAYLGYSSGRIKRDAVSIGTTVATNVFAVQMWVFQPGFLGPAWFVSSIVFCYYLFPCLLPRMQRAPQLSSCSGPFWGVACLTLGIPWGVDDAAASPATLQTYIGACYTAQFLVALVLVIVFGTALQDWELAFWAATGWPPSRLPVFIAGCFGGLLRLSSPETGDVPPRNGPHAADANAGFLAMLFVGFSLLQIFTGWDVGFTGWGQIAFVHVWVGLVYALTRPDAAKTTTYAALASRPMLYLGRISYALYLVHEEVRCYAAFLLNGVRTEPDYHCDDDDPGRSQDPCDDWKTWRKKYLIPPWAIAPVIAVSVVVAAILERVVETPAREYLRGGPSKTAPATVSRSSPTA